VPANTPVFLLGLAVGTCLLLIGLLLGYWFGRRSQPASDLVDRQQFLFFLRNLSNWTSEFSGSVSRYQNQITNLNDRVQEGAGSREEVTDLLRQIMDANRGLQQRLESAERKLETQTDQITNYLTEARTDGLTGLFNRRAFDKATDELFADWQKRSQAFSLGLIDIDHFKKINDSYGHPAGDAVLKHVAGVMQSELDDVVCVARYGGEEFAVLTLASAEEAAMALEQLRGTIGRIEVEHEGQVISVTLSGGVSQIGPDDKIGKLVRSADEALYAAKLAGRNRIYLNDGTVCHAITKPATSVSTGGGGDGVGGVPQLLPLDIQAAATRQAIVEQRLQRLVEEESNRLTRSS
jgi:diguanylate cyclase